MKNSTKNTAGNNENNTLTQGAEILSTPETFEMPDPLTDIDGILNAYKEIFTKDLADKKTRTPEQELQYQEENLKNELKSHCRKMNQLNNRLNEINEIYQNYETLIASINEKIQKEMETTTKWQKKFALRILQLKQAR